MELDNTNSIMLSKIYSATVIGLESCLIEIEVDITQGLPGMTIVGLPDTAVNESKERIRLALRNSGIVLPQKRFVINLAPAEVKKIGTAYDFPIALCILSALEMLQFDIQDKLFIGELGLDGELRKTNGILPISLFAKSISKPQLYIPYKNAAEVSLINNIQVYPIHNLSQVIDHLRGNIIIKPFKSSKIQITPEKDVMFDMALIQGQETAKRALEISAAGAHNILMTGSPGSGKTLLSRTFNTILPEMDEEEIVDVSKLYSIHGYLNEQQPLILKRPFRAPHHTASRVSLIGGGTFPKPGEISLAHYGVLFLDEFPEFPRSVLESLRQPLEDKVIHISRVQGSVSFPAHFILIASQNPCPCGYLYDSERTCVCSEHIIQKYRQKVSGPLLDRIDMIIYVDRVKTEQLIKVTHKHSDLEDSKSIKDRVTKARLRQTDRFKNLSIKTNSEMGLKEIRSFCEIDPDGMDLLKQAIKRLNLSARGYNRVLKLARTIADLDGSDQINISHISESLHFRERRE